MPMPNVTAAAMAAANPVIRCIDYCPSWSGCTIGGKWLVSITVGGGPGVAMLRVFNPGAYDRLTPA
jgi:hypothetical protein